MEGPDTKRRRCTRECLVCREDKGVTAFPGRITGICRHVRDVCRRCMRRTIQMEIQTKGRAAEAKCPTCSAPLSLADVARESSKKDAEHLDKLLLQKVLSQEPSFCWCAHGCEVGQMLEDIGPNIFMTCQQCSRRTCTHHRSKWHDELTCAEYDSQQAAKEQLFCFTVDNGTLKSHSNGLCYRWSPNLNDKAKRFAQWDSCVRGHLHSVGWVAVGNLFLPTRIRSIRVLQPRPDSYQLDNTALRSPKRGVFYRSSCAWEDITDEIAEWGDFVQGTPIDEKWIKVDSRFLPVYIKGIRILKLQAGLCQYMQKKSIQCCPSCRQGIEKKQGCDHMTCPCGAQFCYRCGADYLGPKGIFAVGNHVHKKTCRHYRPVVSR
ncbi:Uncharacterized protein SCF082_LOCUS21384 [Durusdinium trenchii]|uniref:RBR-type E3 ubiquitin transferase n=1 Tax=Durusdinium trenchii TaxID=1381693 RepID=A0ABP0L927_9DINO